MLLSPLVDRDQQLPVSVCHTRRGGDGGWVVEGAVDETLPATLLRIEDPVQGIFYMLSSGDRFWQAGADQVFKQTEPLTALAGSPQSCSSKFPTLGLVRF